MSAHHELSVLEARVMELEVKASYTEDLLEQLNMTIYRQQQRMDALAEALRELRQRTSEGASGGGAGGNPRDDIPPHY